MKRSRIFASLLPVVVGIILTLWGLKVLYTSFTSGSMPIAGWHTDQDHKNHFGLTWFMAFSIVLLPVYLYAISFGLQTFQKKREALVTLDQSRWATAFGVATLLCLLTFCARVAVTAWFPNPLHIPFEQYQGGLVPGIVTTISLLFVEAGVLFAIKHQTQRKRQPMALLIPGLFALLLLAWAGWITFTAFKEGSLPVVGWQTDHPRLFGVAWLVAFLVVLLPAYLFSAGLGLLGMLERPQGERPTDQNSWLVAIGFTALLGLLTFCTRVAVTAWFNEPMHPPLDHFQGGLISGLITTIMLGGVVVLFHRVARAF
jgi:hypothetical protein